MSFPPRLPPRRRPASARLPAGIAAAALCLLAAGCAIGSRRIQPREYPFDPRLDCRFDDRHVILFLVDGCRADLFDEMVRAGELPAIRRYLVERGASAACAVSTVPSVTNSAVAALNCGRFPGRLNVVGNRWFDREKSRHVSVLGLLDYERTCDYLAGPTIHEVLPDEFTIALFSRCPRGSTYTIPIYYNLIGMRYYLAGDWGKVDEAFLGEFSDVAACANREGLFPRYVFFHLAGYDAVSHRMGTSSAAARELLRNVDRGLGRIVEALERNGVLDRVCLVLTADHGQVPVSRANHVALGRELERRTGLPAFECSGGSDRPGERRHDRFAVIAAVNGRNAFLHFRHNPEGKWVAPGAMAPWRERPPWEELRRYRTPRGTVDLVEALRGARGVSLVAGRPCAGEIALFSATGEGRIRMEGEAAGARFAYEAVAGDDPLGYRDAPEAAALMDGRPHGLRDWLKATCGLERPDVVAQLPSIFEGSCSGDLYVVAADDWDFGGGNASEHGGLLRGEMLVPLVVAGPRIRRGSFGPVRIVDIAPTILDYLGHGSRAGEAGMDGVSFLKEISAP